MFKWSWRCSVHVCANVRTFTYKRAMEHILAVAFFPIKPIYFVLSHFCVILWGSSVIICAYGAFFIDESQLSRPPPPHPWSVELIAAFWWLYTLFSSLHKEVPLSCMSHFDSLCVHTKWPAGYQDLCAIKTCTHQCAQIIHESVRLGCENNRAVKSNLCTWTKYTLSLDGCIYFSWRGSAVVSSKLRSRCQIVSKCVSC